MERSTPAALVKAMAKRGVIRISTVIGDEGSEMVRRMVDESDMGEGYVRAAADVTFPVRCKGPASKATLAFWDDREHVLEGAQVESERKAAGTLFHVFEKRDAELNRHLWLFLPDELPPLEEAPKDMPKKASKKKGREGDDEKA